MLISEDKGIVEDAVVNSVENKNGESTVHVIIELQIKSKAF